MKLQKLMTDGAPLIVALALAGCNSGGSSAVPVTMDAPSRRPATFVPEWRAKGLATPACPQVIGKATCLVLVESKKAAGATVSGWTPSDIQARYNLPSSTKGSGQIVAIVDAYDNPHVASDLAVYRKKFGLGKADFYKYNQDGQLGHYPSGNKFWGGEIDADVEIVSAACPRCTIYLVEANSDAASNLEAAEAEAVSLGAHIVSNSWIAYDSNTYVDPSYFDTPGVIYTAASGDEAYNQNGVPESFASVVSVGGTVLSKKGSKYSEFVWDGSGGGCSDNGTGNGIAKSSWQTDPDCRFRTDADIAAVAWNVAVYDTYGRVLTHDRGWFWVGGTSLATPLIAAVFALAGNASSQNAGKNFWTMSDKKRSQDLHSIGRGEDGSCGGEYLCTAGTKQFGTYAGPIGWGTPNGIGAF